MKDYIILTDSASDLPCEIAKELGIDVLPMKYTVNDKTFTGDNFDPKHFYDLLRSKVSALTTQINVEQFSDYFSKYLEKGKDILYIGLSLSLSGMNNSARLAANELCGKYPDRKIVVIDSMAASIGQGILAYYAAIKKNSGLEIEEVKDWIEKNKLRSCHWFTVDDLHHLKRGGRISPATAVIGSILNVKPLLSMDKTGNLYVYDKIRGLKKVLDLVASKIESLDPNYNKVFVGHSDCQSGAEYLAEKIKNINPFCDITILNMGPIIGSHTGPNTVSLAFVGNSR